MKADSVEFGPARDFERHIGSAVRNVGDVERARCLELGAGNRGYRDRHVAQRLLAAARGDDDLAVIALRLFRLRLGGGSRAGILRESGDGGERSEGGTGMQNRAGRRHQA
jgi:hypothetical protein